MSHQRTALITGASAGIGAAFARHLAQEGYNLLLVARRAEKLQALATELQQRYGVTCTVFAADLNDPTAPQAIIDFAQAQQINIDILINNAGLAGKGSFAGSAWSELAGEIQVMITAVTHLCHLVLPHMRAQGWRAVMRGQPVCVTGLVNKVVASSVRPLPIKLQYFLGNNMNPFKK